MFAQNACNRQGGVFGASNERPASERRGSAPEALTPFLRFAPGARAPHLDTRGGPDAQNGKRSPSVFERTELQICL